MENNEQKIKAMSLLKSNRLTEACQAFRDICNTNEDDFEAWYTLGGLAGRLGEYGEAEACLRKALVLQPSFAGAHLNLGAALFAQGKYEEAMSVLTRLQANARSSKVQIEIANVFRRERKLEEALQCYRTAIQLEPDNITALSGEVEIYSRLGEFDKSYEHIQSLIRAKNINPTIIDVYADICHRYDSCNDAAKQARMLLKKKSLSPQDRQVLCFALGKLYDRAGAYDKAFKQYQLGNSISKMDFDSIRHSKEITDIISLFSKEFMVDTARATNQSDRPIFIVGMPRSGTSLIEQIIASHPDVAGGGELNDMKAIVASLSVTLEANTSFPVCLNNIDQSALDALASRYLDSLEMISADHSRVTDKMPQNFLYLGLIELMFPNARIIHCKRDALDTSLSIYFQRFGVQHPYAAKLDNLGDYYKEYERLMSHWVDVLNIPIIEIQYEQLVAGIEDVSRTMIEFCKLTWDQSCLDFHRTKRAVATASYAQVRQPVHTQSVGRNVHYKKYLEPLRQALT